uniref:Uncharacterized protein n=1 Tax=Streptomyces sp. NBC_00049 TaxID=2903617 RepID=A0AAU2JWQ8_9ACTN
MTGSHTSVQTGSAGQACGSWVAARPGSMGCWEVASAGPRDNWEEIQHTAARWQAAG